MCMYSNPPVLMVLELLEILCYEYGHSVPPQEPNDQSKNYIVRLATDRILASQP
jgi:hypothetical protein